MKKQKKTDDEALENGAPSAELWHTILGEFLLFSPLFLWFLLRERIILLLLLISTLSAIWW